MSEVSNTPTEPDLGWHVISGEDLLTALRRGADGEDPDLVYAEMWANARHESDEVLAMDLTAAEMAADGKRVWEPARTDLSNRIEEARALLERALVLTHAHYQKRRGGVVQPLRDDIKAWLG